MDSRARSLTDQPDMRSLDAKKLVRQSGVIKLESAFLILAHRVLSKGKPQTLCPAAIGHVSVVLAIGFSLAHRLDNHLSSSRAVIEV